jgi:N-methylhydantoinase A
MSEPTPAVGVDVGGTFTDVVLVVDGEVTTAKVPTTEDQSRGVRAGIEAACERADIDPDAVESFRHGTTVATNAMLERNGARTALVTTDGFGDVLEIGRQDRPELYDLNASKPEPLVPATRRYELDERATTETIEREVTEADVERVRADLVDAGVESVAVSLLHAYAHPENERQVLESLQASDEFRVVASHETLPEFREYERTATTVADAYVGPVVESYLDELLDRTDRRGIPSPDIVQSNGGVAGVDAVRERAVTTLLSGPAAGVVGAALFEPADTAGVVTFDMGGTSSDVGLVRDGGIERTSSASVGGHPVGVSMVDIETVGAGGGSLAWVDSGGALRVGPESAGADPGPVCYGAGGRQPTVTDAAAVRGYLGDETTLGGDLELDIDRARTALAALAREADLDGPQAAARGVCRVANATMTRTIRRVTLERGHDTRGFGLVAFGGAGPMFAAELAARLGIRQVLVPLASGVLSALGALAADQRHDASRTVRARLDAVDPDTIERRYRELADEACERTSDPERASVDRRVDLRYAGQSHELTVELDAFEPAEVAERFHAVHERRRGYRLESPIEVITLRVSAVRPSETPVLSHGGTRPEPVGHRKVRFGDGGHETPVYDRERVPTGTDVEGPAVLAGTESTVVVPPGWDAGVDDRGTLRLERGEP